MFWFREAGFAVTAALTIHRATVGATTGRVFTSLVEIAVLVAVVEGATGEGWEWTSAIYPGNLINMVVRNSSTYSILV